MQLEQAEDQRELILKLIVIPNNLNMSFKSDSFHNEFKASSTTKKANLKISLGCW